MTAASSQRARTLALVVLTLWFVVSLIVIVVWSTSPDLKSSAQCREELKHERESLQQSREERRKDRDALEQQLERERGERDRLSADNLLLLGLLNATNSSLQDSREENRVLHGNISVLTEEVEQLQETKTNLTVQLQLEKEHAELLQLNLTSAEHQTQSCLNLKAAARSQMLAAQSDAHACQSQQQALSMQLQKCRVKSETSQQKGPGNAASPLVATVTLFVCSLHLLT